MAQLYQELARLLLAMRNCERSGNKEWHSKHRERVLSLVKDRLPSGAGFDSGTSIDLDGVFKSAPDRLTFDVSFHHLHENGYYVGWTTHRVIVRPSLAFGFDLRVTGRDRNQIKEYIAESFDSALRETVESIVGDGS